MKSPARRKFLKQSVAAVAGMPLLSDALHAQESQPANSPMNTRDYWISVAQRIARPVLENLAARTLKKNMPVEERPGAKRTPVTHLEAFGRLIAGIAPWLEQDQSEPWLKLAQQSLDAATDPQSPDFLNFSQGTQPLVDTAFLAQGILRAPTVLWKSLDARVQKNVITALKSSRSIKPHESNWLLFAAMVEAALERMGEPVVRERVGRALKKHMEWYKGDGIYGDGPNYHADYYNSFVIQPMLVDVITVFRNDKEWKPLADEILKRAQRHAEIQERQISPEGAYPVIGRSMAYRFGAFHGLAQIALLEKLSGITPAGVRCALTKVIRRQIAAQGTFDANGWLTIGFCGHQPSIADNYVSTGSLYLCSTVLLPLGLPKSNPFWNMPDEPWTQAKAWSGIDISGDHSI